MTQFLGRRFQSKDCVFKIWLLAGTGNGINVGPGLLFKILQGWQKELWLDLFEGYGLLWTCFFLN